MSYTPVKGLYEIVLVREDGVVALWEIYTGSEQDPIKFACPGDIITDRMPALLNNLIDEKGRPRKKGRVFHGDEKLELKTEEAIALLSPAANTLGLTLGEKEGVIKPRVK